jgi:hypothetical protein
LAVVFLSVDTVPVLNYISVAKPHHFVASPVPGGKSDVAPADDFSNEKEIQKKTYTLKCRAIESMPHRPPGSKQWVLQSFE